MYFRCLLGYIPIYLFTYCLIQLQDFQKFIIILTFMSTNDFLALGEYFRENNTLVAIIEKFISMKMST